MSPFNPVLWQLAFVLPALFCNGVLDVFLLKEHVSSVGDVRQNHLDIGITPLKATLGSDAFTVQLALCLQTGLPIKEVLEYASDDGGLFRDNDQMIPMGFLTPDILCSDLVFLIPDASLYHFGILTSNVHMAWVRTVCGRLEMRYRYSKDIVYNNFPWPTPTDEQKSKIEQTAQAILDARAKYPDASLADLYDELTMPPELRTAHQQNDRAVMEAYGMPVKTTTESSCVADLMRRYQALTAAHNM